MVRKYLDPIEATDMNPQVNYPRSYMSARNRHRSGANRIQMQARSGLLRKRWYKELGAEG